LGLYNLPIRQIAKLYNSMNFPSQKIYIRQRLSNTLMIINIDVNTYFLVDNFPVNINTVN